jgi:hypothetical protein
MGLMAKPASLPLRPLLLESAPFVGYSPRFHLEIRAYACLTLPRSQTL